MRKKTCKYSECKKRFEPERQFQTTCSFDCAIGYAKEQEEKKRAKTWSQKKARMKESIKSLSSYKKDLQKLVNEIARRIDHDQECISCGTKEGKVNGGHFHSVGSNPALRFNLLNIFRQCEKCNSYLSGNLLNYEKGLQETFGESVKYEIKYKLAVLSPELKASKEEIKEAIYRARQIVKDLKTHEMKHDKELRIHLRRIANKELGLYD